MPCARCCFAALALSVATPLLAQSDQALRSFFEGKQVVVKIDMPAASSGVDVYPGREIAVDYRALGDSLKQYGIALRKGDSVMITKVHLKGKLVEFQLSGGGYGTFGDLMREPSAPNTVVPESKRERDLENERKNTTDPNRKRQIDRQLDDLRRDREREQARLEAGKAQVVAAQQAQINDKRAHSGSRFNIRYSQNLSPQQASPQAIMAVLAQYVDFPGQEAQSRRVADSRSLSAALHKGMSEGDVTTAAGNPSTRNAKYISGMDIVECTYQLTDGSLNAQFVNGVLTSYTVSSR